MKHPFSVARAAACVLLAMTGIHAHAQQAVPAAADPQAAVPATGYQSALAYRPEPAPASSPDRNWVASNQTVAATNSMALTMKSMGGQHEHAAMSGMSMPMQQQDGAGMCMPGDKGGKDDKAAKPAQGKMSGCGACCESGCKCCKDHA
ncbi:MAG: hypothetical protein ACXWC2_21625 [Ramlibacter sp.]